MQSNNRTQMMIGGFLILLGIWFLAVRFMPGLAFLNDWPMIIVSVGVGLLIFGILSGAPGMAVPATIVAGLGGIFAYQTNTGDWASWAYIWTLIPGFVGLGIMLTGLLEGDLRSKSGPGGWLLLISAVMFGFFGAFLGAGGVIGTYWPALLVLVGVILLAQSAFGRQSA